MENHLHASTHRPANIQIRQVPLDKLHPFQADKVLALARSKVVHPAHIITTLQERRRDRPPNKPRRAGNQILRHLNPLNARNSAYNAQLSVPGTITPKPWVFHPGFTIKET